MSSTNSSPNHHSSKRQATNHSSRTTKRTNRSKDVLLHYPMSLPPPDDWVLFSQDIVTHKNSNFRHAPLSGRTKSATTCFQTLPPDGHVTELETTTPAMTAIRFPRKPYKPSHCLNHISARNCTAACVDTRPPPLPMNMGMPPKAPSPPRLPTPELPELEEDDSWSCCMFSESNESGKSTQTNDDFWNENDEKFTQHIRRQENMK